MISVELARRLREAGLVWKPAPGDRFVIADRDMDAEVFVVSQLTIDVRETPGGPVFLFNGTTDGRWTAWRRPTPSGCRTRPRCVPRSAPPSAVWSRSATAGSSRSSGTGAGVREVDVDAERAYARRAVGVARSLSAGERHRDHRPRPRPPPAGTRPPVATP